MPFVEVPGTGRRTTVIINTDDIAVCKLCCVADPGSLDITLRSGEKLQFRPKFETWDACIEFVKKVRAAAPADARQEERLDRLESMLEALWYAPGMPGQVASLEAFRSMQNAHK